MPRQAREKGEFITYHIVQRVNEQKKPAYGAYRQQPGHRSVAVVASGNLTGAGGLEAGYAALGRAAAFD